jgi:hypothetical protein
MGGFQPPDVVRGSIHFLLRHDLYKEEKPYTIRYTVPEDVPRSNSKHKEYHDIPIEDIRDRISEFSLAENGFMIAKLESAMAYADFAREDRIVDCYLAEVARTLRKTLNARHVQVYEHTVSYCREIRPSDCLLLMMP